jgi:HSP20 family protein
MVVPKFLAPLRRHRYEELEHHMALLARRAPFSAFYPTQTQYSGLEITKDETGYTVELPVAGFKPEQIDVTLDQKVLTIAGNSEKRQFTRSLLVPEEIDAETIQATVENGMLTLRLGFTPKAQPKKINVSFAQ